MTNIYGIDAAGEEFVTAATEIAAQIKEPAVEVDADARFPQEAITALASTITLTPGTVSADLSSGGHTLLVHCLHTEDPDGVREEIKSRYERRLMEIFE